MAVSSNQLRSCTKMPHGLVSVVFIFALMVAWLGRRGGLSSYPDILWHRKAGEWMLKHGQIPTHDPWSYTAGEQTWLNLSWLFDVVLSLGYQTFGEPGMAVLAVLSLAFWVAWVARVLLKEGYGAVAVVTVVFWLPVLFMQSWVWRPQLVTIMFSFVWVWHLFYRDWQWANILKLAALYLLWVNMHGGFMVVWLLLLVAGWNVCTKWSFEKLWMYLVLVALSAVATFMTPWGASIMEAVWRTMGSPIREWILEWRPLWQSKEPATLWGYVIFAHLVLWWGRKSVRMTELFLVCGTCLMMVLSVRHTGVMLSATALPLARLLHTKINHQPWWRKKSVEYSRDLVQPAARLFLGVIAVIVAGASGMVIGWVEQNRQEDVLRPAQAFAYLATLPQGTKLWNDYAYGASILYDYGGHVRHAIDGRADTAYPRQVVQDYVHYILRQDGWENLPAQYDAQVVVMPSDDAHWQGLSSAGWVRVDSVEDALVMIRREVP
jgi:hypothetical protein